MKIVNGKLIGKSIMLILTGVLLACTLTLSITMLKDIFCDDAERPVNIGGLTHFDVSTQTYYAPVYSPETGEFVNPRD